MRGFLLAAGLAVLAAACGQQPAAVRAPAPPAAPAPGDLGLRAFEGRSYGELVISPGLARFAPQALGLEPAEQARFIHAMSQTAPAWIVTGGGETALVIVGCDADACASAAGILVIDNATGEFYVAVRDEQGREALAPNDRLAALVEATTPADRWADPDAWADGAPG